MSLPSPNLDDRTFQDIVDDVKRQIGRRCPEWTDHNVSDPGVTLIELFAYMTELTLYRLNRVPEKNYIKFLEMIGVTLESASPAMTDLWFLLSRSIEDIDGEEAYERTLRARETVASTVRTEYEESVDFTIDTDLSLARPRLTQLFFGAGEAKSTDPAPIRDMPQNEEPFLIFSETPKEGDAFYFGFEGAVSRNIVDLEIDALQSAATGLNEDYPAQRWEYWNASEAMWDGLEIISDTSFGFNRGRGAVKDGKPTGIIRIAFPANLSTRLIDGRRATWIRCRYTTNLPAKGQDQLRPNEYQKSPEVKSIQASTVGGVVPASHCVVIVGKEMGQSDGAPGQVFSLGQSPILPRSTGEAVLVGEQGVPQSEWEIWTEVDDFAESLAADRHFVCDSFTGEVYFGPSVRQPDGSVRQHGAVPAKGRTIVFSSYRFGGGLRGNVAAGQIEVLKSSIPYIATVTNPRRAEGGREAESLERAKLRGRMLLRQRDRAVTVEDYERLAIEASSGIARAFCIQPKARHTTAEDSNPIPPGVVRVLLIPALGAGKEVPRPLDFRVPERVRKNVESYLDERRLLTAVLETGEPDYVYVSTEITIAAEPNADSDRVARNIRSRLETFIHPLCGGPQGDGWPFCRTLTLADIYAQIQVAAGVAFLLEVKFFVSRLINVEEGRLSREEAVASTEGIRLKPNEMIATREHRVRVRSFASLGNSEDS